MSRYKPDGQKMPSQYKFDKWLLSPAHLSRKCKVAKARIRLSSGKLLEFRSPIILDRDPDRGFFLPVMENPH